MNIELNYMQEDGTYVALYPQTLGSLVNGAVAQATKADNADYADTAGAAKNAMNAQRADVATTADNASYATYLMNSRTIQTNLASTSSASFNGGSNITPGVTGILGLSNGGTGVTSLSALKSSLGISDSGGSVAGNIYAGYSVSSSTTRSYTFYWSGFTGMVFIGYSGYSDYTNNSYIYTFSAFNFTDMCYQQSYFVNEKLTEEDSTKVGNPSWSSTSISFSGSGISNIPWTRSGSKIGFIVIG